MINIKELLKDREIQVIGGRAKNIDYEDADRFAKYLGFNTLFILKLFKIYGKDRVLSLQSYLKDFSGNCTLSQALVFKLKNPENSS